MSEKPEPWIIAIAIFMFIVTVGFGARSFGKYWAEESIANAIEEQGYYVTRDGLVRIVGIVQRKDFPPLPEK